MFGLQTARVSINIVLVHVLVKRKSQLRSREHRNETIDVLSKPMHVRKTCKLFILYQIYQTEMSF